MEQGIKKVGIRSIIFLQLIVIVYTFSTLFGKLATRGNEFFSPMFFLFLVLDVVVLGCYALLWQQALKRFDLNIAYANRSLAIIWSMIWSVVFLQETITVGNIVGAAIIITGTILVNTDVKRD